MAATLNHVALTVSDRDHSANFYANYFGFTDRVHEDDHLLILTSKGGGLLALSAGNPEEPWKRTTHFGFELASAAEVHSLRKRFNTDGIREAEWQEKNPTRVQVFDPDGYRVEAYGWI